ncbi:MAG: ATP-binding protein [Planctomycetota bacterium]|jgi:Holliday junction DNA helicase RuvB
MKHVEHIVSYEHVLSVDEDLQRALDFERLTNPVKVRQVKFTVPDDLFNAIYGHDDIKELFKRSMLAKKPVHILLVGPPATSKSLFLDIIASLDDAIPLTAGNSTSAGMRDLIMEQRPRFIVIDELDKVRSVKDLTTLLTIAETGKLTRTLATTGHEVIEHKVWIFAGANRMEDIMKKRPELASRMIAIHIPAYDRETAIKVMVHVLRTREKIDASLSVYIAHAVVDIYKSHDPRDAVKVSRLCKTQEEVDWSIEMMMKYRAEAWVRS